ncbi:inositol monophosphatase family protein [Kribbella sp. NPDC050241]|uniref:inositol monophosphatase family protein n=1 Tax=Kribbella sp. NPDC050241 TaxID=3364115 RepID=UPI0037985FC7
MDGDRAREYSAFARGVALKAGRLMLEGFRSDVKVTTKQDGSPVTEVDERINRMVKSELLHAYPDHGLLGEELNSGTGAESSTWICDPLDGTRTYLLGIPNSVFMLALQQGGLLNMAVVYDPFSDSLYQAVRGGGAFLNGAPLRVSGQDLSEGLVLLGTTSRPFVPALQKFGAATQSVAGSGYKAMMVARGKGVGTIKSHADFHDVASSALIVVEAGGRASDLAGSPLVFDSTMAGVILSNGAAHQQLVEIANQWDE